MTEMGYNILLDCKFTIVISNVNSKIETVYIENK